MAKSLYIIDGHYQIFRAYYAPFSRLTAPSGEPTKATYAFCNALFNLIRNRRPDYLVVTMDHGDETTFRRVLDPNYKANREAPPEDFAPQAERIVSIIQAMGVPILTLPGYEADDLMATIAERVAHDGLETFLVSKDKDLEQLITDSVRLYDAGDDRVIDAEALAEKKGYTPQQVVDVQTLAGDNVDNIPGVVGVGVKTAAKLVNTYGSADAVLAHADELTPKMRERVKAFAEQLPITRQLVTLHRDVPIEFDLDACRFDGIPVGRVRGIFKDLGFTRLTEQLDSMPASTAGDDADASNDDANPTDAAANSTSSTSATATSEYLLIDTPDALDKLCKQLATVDAFAFDTETTALNPVMADLVGISIATAPGNACYIPVRAAMGQTLTVELVVEKLKPVFADGQIKKCGHNIKYDIVVLKQVGIEVAGVEFDSMIASFLLDPLGPSRKLDSLARDICGHEMIPITDLIGKGKNQTTMDQLDTGRVGEYAAEDADFTWRLCEHFRPRMANSPVRRLFEELEMPLVEVLADMENNGVAIDTDVLAKMSNTMAQRMHELTGEIHAAAGRLFNIDSTKQLAEVLFDEQGLQVVRKTKTGRSTDAESLSTLAATTTNPIPPLVLEYRELAKLKGTYVDALPETINPKTGRIHASFHQTGAATGRLSSSDPNLQNIPVRTEMGREIRRAFVAGLPDHVLLVADYSQIELRIMAHFCGDATLLRAFGEGQDIHAFVAAQVNGVPVDQVTKEQRSAAKAVNFGIIYGQTPFGLSRTLGIPVPEAKAFIDTYFMRYPGIRMFIDQCIADAKKKGYAETMLGRRRPVAELRSRNRAQAALGERIAVNTVVQGTAADLIKKAMLDIHQTIRAEKLPIRMLIQVHDELVFEVPKKEIETQSKMICEKMCTAIPLNVPLAVDINSGPNWLESK